MSESQFWAVYFTLVDKLLVLDSKSEGAEGNGELGDGQSPGRLSNAARSGLSGWEAVHHEDATSRPASSPVADAADDLDAYLKVCLIRRLIGEEAQIIPMDSHGYVPDSRRR